MGKLIVILFAFGLSASGGQVDFAQVSEAIRNNNLSDLRHLVSSKDAANTANRLKETPLHYAALYGSPEAMRLLLEAGADPNARNQAGGTPLVYAAWSLERTRLLVEHGARVNSATNQKLTPLLVAAAARGNTATVRFLLEKGADLQARSNEGEDALIRAAAFGDYEMLKLLLDRGADPKRADDAGFTALQNATRYPDSGRIRLLLKAGSDPNSFNTFAGMVKNGPIALVHLTPLMTAAPYSDQETITCLLKAGARVNESDSRKLTPLMLSIATDHAQVGTVRQLLTAGADLQAKDIYGDSALDWARKYGNPEIVSVLEQAGAKGEEPSGRPLPDGPAVPSDPRESAGRALKLFGKSDFFRMGGGCAGCHHQPAHARAFAVAVSSHLDADPGLRKAFDDATMAIRPRLQSRLPYLSSLGGDIDAILPLLAAKADLNEAPDELTDLMTHFIALRQDQSGAWINFGTARAPLAESSISRTASAIEALADHAWPAREAEFKERILRARRWLQEASPETTYEHAERILGLHVAGVETSKLRADADRLLGLQRADGGWAQTKYLEPDAYATGLVLESLFRAGVLGESDPAYRRGVSFLLKTQFADGSWYVRSRAPKFQPYFQSGFPFDHDQWISSVGTAWAAMALSHSAGPSSLASRQVH